MIQNKKRRLQEPLQKYQEHQQRKLLQGLLILSTLLCFGRGSVIQTAEKSMINPTGNISIETIIDLMKIQNFEIKAAKKNNEAKKAIVIQSGLLPNPDLELESENIFGTGINTGISRAQTTAKIRTLIEMGRKQHYRIQAAKLSESMAGLHYVSVIMTGINTSSQLGFELLRQQEKLILDKERLKTNQKLLEEITIKVQKGRLSVVEKKRAKIVVIQTHLRIKKRKQMIMSVKDKISIMWGYPQSRFKKMKGDLKEMSVLPELDILRNQLLNNVNLKKKQWEIEQAKVAIKIQNSLNAQDLSVGGGITHDNSNNHKSFVLSVQFPIGIFDTNTGSIKAAESKLKLKKLKYKNALIKAKNRLKTLYFETKLLKDTIVSLRNEIIPQSREVFAMLKEGYLKGKFSYLEVLEAQDTLFDFKENFIDTLAEYHRSVLEIKLITGSLLKGEKNDTFSN